MLYLSKLNIPAVLTLFVALGMASLATTAPVSADKKRWPRAVEKAFKTIKPKDCLEHVMVLASDAYEGRSCGEEGGRKASEYIARAFEGMGLEPGGSSAGSYFQPFSVRLRRTSEGPMELSNRLLFTKKPGARDEVYDFGEDFVPDRRSAEHFARGPLTFMGTEADPQLEDVDIDGRIAVLLASPELVDSSKADSREGDARKSAVGQEDPPATGSADDDSATQSAVWPLVDELEERGCTGVILVTDDRDVELDVGAWKGGKPEDSSALPVIRLTSKCSDKLIRKLGGRLDKIVDDPTRIVEFDKGRLWFETSRRGFVYGRGRNVVGVLRGSDPELSKEAVVVGAHFDHVGYARDPRLTNGQPGQIHNGADDNSSGTTGIIEMARAFAENDIRPKRSIVFIAFDAEELGLLGSKYYAEDPPTFPIDKTVCMINMDMISRNDPVKMYIGKLDDYSGLNRIVADVASHFGITLDPTGMEKYIKRSDQWSFMEKGVPAVFLYGGDHPQYHTEKDDIRLANPNKIVNITRLMFLAAYECGNHDGGFGKK